MGKKTLEELLWDYQKVAAKVKQDYKESLPQCDIIRADLLSVLELYKGTNIQEIIVGDFNNNYDIYHARHNEREKELKNRIVNDEEELAFLDNIQCKLISSDKEVTLSITPRPGYSNTNYPRTGSDGVSMFQATEGGIYTLFLNRTVSDTAPGYIIFYCNAALSEAADRYGLTLDEIKYKCIHGEGNNFAMNPSSFNTFDTTDIDKNNLAKFANSIYRKGLPAFDEHIKDEKPIAKIIDEDAFYAPTESEQATIEEIQENLSAKNESQITISETALEEEQAQSNLTEKLHSERFIQYKNNREEREEHQQTILRERAQENTAKEEWQNSPEHPNNKRIEELKHLKAQISALEKVREVDESLLSKEQQSLIEEGNIFLDMVDNANKEEHLVDTGMSSEMREWYQEHYSEGKGAK